MGHYLRKQSGFYILYGGPDGYSPEAMEFHKTEATSDTIAIADINNDGNLDLLVPAYSTQFTRELPAFIYYGDGKTFDFDNPVIIPCNSSCAFTAVDISGNGYLDLIAVCHRNDLGHQVDSLLFHNGPEGLDLKNPKHIPGMGPHGMCTRDFGNRKDRKPVEYYESQICNIESKTPKYITWKGETPTNTQLKFQLRWSSDKDDIHKKIWHGPSGGDTYYEKSGEEIKGVPNSANYLQYRVLFISTNGCSSPKLEDVTIELSC